MKRRSKPLQTNKYGSWNVHNHRSRNTSYNCLWHRGDLLLDERRKSDSKVGREREEAKATTVRDYNA